MKRYPSRFEGPATAPARCIELLAQVPAEGVVLDLGCGRGQLAEPVKELGRPYVGTDIDREALAEVSERGFETHYLDLGGSEADLADGLREVLAGRSLSAMLTVDLLEHLIEPDRLLRALRQLGEEASLIVSIPNVTHLNVAAKLLLGRWDPTECGLLDDTHLRYFSEGLMTRLLGATGWRQVDAADAVDPDSFDQRFPQDSPVLRPGTPARDLLRRLRSDAEPHGSTYQFVRRFVPDVPEASGRFRWVHDPESDRARPFASVIVQTANRESAQRERLLADLAAQGMEEFETLEVPDGVEGWNEGIESATGRYLLFLDDTCGVAPDWIESFEGVPEPLGGRILKANAVSVPSRRLDRGGEELIAGGKPLEINSLDLLELQRPRPTVLAAYAVPAEAVRAAGVRFESRYGDAAPAVFLSRLAELSGVLPVAATTVAVAETKASGDEAALASVAESLDSTPLILPAGSATKILALREAATHSMRWRVRQGLRSLKRRLSQRQKPGGDERARASESIARR